jgi:hypothetical protein
LISINNSKWETLSHKKFTEFRKLLISLPLNSFLMLKGKLLNGIQNISVVVIAVIVIIIPFNFGGGITI